MKGIKVDNRILIREGQRMIDRNVNSLSINFNIDPLKDMMYTQESLIEIGTTHYTISKDSNFELWNILKDASNDGLIDHIFSVSQQWKEVFESIPPKEIIELIEDPAKGAVEVVTGTEEESPEYKLKKELNEKYNELSSILTLAEKYDFEVVVI